MFLKKIINKIFGIQAAHNILWYLAIIRRIFIKPKKYISPQLVFRGSMMDIFNKKKYFVIKDSKLLFSLRDMGNSSVSRGKNFFLKEPKTISWINNFNSNSKFLDIGANVGIFSLYAAYKGHDVVSVEPESLNFAALNINTNDNNFNQKIRTYPFSMHSENKIGLLELSEMNWGKSGHNFDSDFNDSGKIFFQGSFGCSIDFLSKEIDFIPDYIKIDVDGNEFKVIHGMKTLLQNKYIKSILVEIDISQKENSEIINYFSKFGYRIISKDTVVSETPNIINYIFAK